jgi:hypothetical protein
MVIYPYSPPMFPQTYSSPPYNTSQDSSSRKRKRQYETEEDLPTHVIIENEHISKKQRDEVVAPLTPTSPPSSVISVQSFSSPLSSEHHLLHNSNNVRIVIGSNTKISIINPSFTIQHPSTSHSSDVVDTPIPPQNLLLRNLHMQSRTYQFNQDHLRSMDKDEEMWEEEEESVAERYSEINKLLRSRKPVW